MYKINHIGIAVHNYENAKAKYLDKGYKILKESYDKYFLVNLCLMVKDNEKIELVYTDNENSSVINMCKNNEEKIYHICYEVKSIEEEIKKLKDENFIQSSEVVYSTLLNGKVCFLYSREKGLIELVEVNE